MTHFSNISSKGDRNKLALKILVDLSNSKDQSEYDRIRESLGSLTNEEFLSYFQRHENRPERWVFFRIPEACRKNRTNLHIESWHKILKYSFLNGKKNKRTDTLIFALLNLDKDFEYKTSIAINKGQISTYKRKITQRHNASLDLQIEGTCVKVFIFLYSDFISKISQTAKIHKKI